MVVSGYQLFCNYQTSLAKPANNDMLFGDQTTMRQATS